MFASGFEKPSTWAIIAIAALVLFGYKKLPDVTRSVGKSLRIFKTELKGMNSDDEARNSAEAAKKDPVVTPEVTPEAIAPTPAPVPPQPSVPSEVKPPETPQP
jgi:sec-independent protein translocase protein TatA